MPVLNSDRERYFQCFFDYVNRLINMPESDQVICRTFFKPIQVKKGTRIASIGSVHHYHNFVVSGYLRKYHIDDHGEEVVVDLNDGPRFFTSYHHFFHRTPSNECIECVTDCELLRISRDDVDRSSNLGQSQQEYTVLILQESLEKQKQRSIELTTLPAYERYLKLLERQPNILRHIPLKYVASYLGINPGSLSRIRKEVA